MFLLCPTTFFWDLTIALLIVFSACMSFGCIIWIKRRSKYLLKKLLVSAVAVISASIGGIVVYGSFVEPQIITVTEHMIDLEISEPITIAVVSDFHVGPFKGKRFVQKVVRTINNSLPDLVLLVGDYIYTEDADLSDLNPLGTIRASLGTFGVLGNHDQGQYATILGKRYFSFNRGEDIADTLESLGIHMLRNTHEIVPLNLGSITIAGIDDMWTADADMAGALRDIPEETPTILLSHNPNVAIDPMSSKADLIVSGHTHGGQVRLPYLGPLILPVGIPREFDQGIISIDESTVLAITRGVGETWGRIRLLAFPEVLILKVQ